MRFGVLGPLAVWTDDGTPVRVPESKVRTLLAALLVDPGQVVSADRLADHLWGDDQPGNPANTLQSKVSQLRRALERAEPGGRDLVVYRPPGYALVVPTTGPDHAVDADRFRALTARARATEDSRTRAALLTEALAVWRGPAFADHTDEPFAATTAEGLEELRLSAVEDAALSRLESGEHTLVADELGEHAREHPLRERLRGIHMRALYGSGRPTEALATYAELRERLSDELGTDPGPELAELHQRILRQDPALSAPPASAPMARTGNLPVPTTAMVGREQERDRVSKLLTSSRLVTLTGPGGVGKTRLALAVADDLVDEFPDGVWLVELSGLRPERAVSGPSAEQVAEEVAAVTGLRDGATDGADRVSRTASALAGQQALLILDNCEHVVEAAAHVASALLRAAPGLRLLATSQEPLAVSGEVLEVVSPLGLPDSDDTATAAASDAVRLFAERARAAAPGFELTEENTADAVAICRRLDGIPLALELAATRVRALGVSGLVERIDDRFRLLTGRRRDLPPRQRTLRAMMDWSWDLATEPERAVLRRLSVHAEGCTLEAAEHVCAGRGVAAEDVLDLLEMLVDRSLVVSVPDREPPRFRLLESVARYGAERLTEAGEEPSVRGRHREYYTGLAARAAPHLHGHHQRQWLGRLDDAKADLRVVLYDALDAGDGAAALRVADTMSWYLALRGRQHEAQQMLTVVEESLADAPDAVDPAAFARLATARVSFDLRLGARQDPGPRTERVLALLDASEPVDLDGRIAHLRSRWSLAFAHTEYGTWDPAERLTADVLRTASALDDDWTEAAALVCRTVISYFRGDLSALRRDAERALRLFVDTGDGWGRVQALSWLALHAETVGDHELAARTHRESLHVAEGLRLWGDLAHHLSGLGRIALLSGDHDRADEFHLRALRVGEEHGDEGAQGFAAVGLGLTARRRGDLEAAEKWLRPWLAWNRGLGPENGVALILAELGFAAEQRGDADKALDLHREGLAAALRIGDPRAVALALEGLAGALSLSGSLDAAERAAGLLGTAAATREAMGAPLPPEEGMDVERIAERLRDALGEWAHAAATEAGRSRAVPTSVDEVLS